MVFCWQNINLEEKNMNTSSRFKHFNLHSICRNADFDGTMHVNKPHTFDDCIFADNFEPSKPNTKLNSTKTKNFQHKAEKCKVFKSVSENKYLDDFSQSEIFTTSEGN